MKLNSDDLSHLIRKGGQQIIWGLFLMIGLLSSCSDDAQIEPGTEIKILQNRLTIEGYLNDTFQEEITIKMSPKPSTPRSISGSLHLSSDEANFNQIAHVEFSQSSYTLNEENDYSVKANVNITSKEDWTDITSTSFSITTELNHESIIQTNSAYFQVNLNYSGREKMDLNELKEGQIFKYIMLKGSDYYEDVDNFEYTGDTLLLEVLEAEENRYLISEKITSLSNMKVNSDEYYSGIWLGDKNAVYKNYWVLKNDSLIFEPVSGEFQSHLISYDPYHIFNYNQNLPLRTFDETEVQITGWKTSHPYTERKVELFTNNYELLSHSYERLNILIDNRLFGGDTFGFTTVYSKQYGIVKTSRIYWWGKDGIGWDKL